MNDIPPYHPEKLVTFWLSTPGLNQLNPHVTVGTLLILGLVLYFFRKKTKTQKQQSEHLFQALLQKRKMIEAKLTELEQLEDKDESLESTVIEYHQLLEEVTRELRTFTS